MNNEEKKIEEVTEEINKSIEPNKKENVFKKVKKSITQIEDYLKMAAEGIPRAIGYLLLLNLIGAAIIGGIVLSEIKKNVELFATYFQDEMPYMIYENKKLEIDSDEKLELGIESNAIKVIANTNELDTLDKNSYIDEIQNSYIGIAIFDEYAVLKSSVLDEQNIIINYEELFDENGIEKIEKADVINYLNSSSMIMNYASIFVLLLIMLVITNTISALATSFIISISGILASKFIGMKIKYKAVFNMSIYSLTLSTIMLYMYIAVNMYTNFEIEYFSVMYMSVSTIYLVAAIFMIKAEIIKKTVELHKMMENQNEEKQKGDQNGREK